MKGVRTGWRAALMWAAATAGWTAEPVYHFSIFMGSQGTMACWVSGAKFCTEQRVNGVKSASTFNGTRLCEYQPGWKVGKLMPRGEISKLTVWKSDDQPAMGPATKGEPLTVGGVSCETLTFSARTRRGVVTFIRANTVSELVLRHELDKALGISKVDLFQDPE